MHMYGRVLPPVVHVAVQLNTSDVPATRKLTGAAGHSHKMHPCNFCLITLAEINMMDGYDDTSESNCGSGFVLLKFVTQNSRFGTTGIHLSKLNSHAVPRQLKHGRTSWISQV